MVTDTVIIIIIIIIVVVVIVIIKKRTERDITQEDQIMYSKTADYSLTNTQPIPGQWSAAPGQLSPVPLTMTFHRISLWPAGVFCPGHPPFWLPVHLLTGRTWDTESPWLRVKTAQHQPRHHDLVNIILLLNLNYSIALAIREKMNSIPVSVKNTNSVINKLVFLADSLFSNSCWYGLILVLLVSTTSEMVLHMLLKCFHSVE